MKTCNCGCDPCKNPLTSQQNITNTTNVVPQGGLSAYELWLEQGNTGTIEDFLNSTGSDPVYVLTEW